MFRKSLMLALAATVSLGAVALSTSTASAFHPAGGMGGSHFSGGGNKSFGGPGLHVSKPLVNGIVIHKPMVNGIKINPGLKFGWHWHHYPRFWWWRYSWRRPYWIAPVVATGGVAAAATSYASTPATNTCTCLTKQYTPQGAVVFKDVCTNEMAMNPPANASPAADAGPQMPQQPYQQGYLQPQAQ
jgi:hypothetical protein